VIANTYSVADTVFPYMCVIVAPPASGVNVNIMPTIFFGDYFQTEIELKL
jgi:hypothetical protein